MASRRRSTIRWAALVPLLVLLLGGPQFSTLLAGIPAAGVGEVKEAVANDSTSEPRYVEQLGETFSQDSTYLSVNVTAIPQNDSDEYGPAYLLNGLTNQGWWYQVGVSYNWPHSEGGLYSGFYFNYEVFSPTGQSVFPSPNSTSFSYFLGNVYAGDLVQLSLAFASGNVSMSAYDWQMHTPANASYSAQGSTNFVGMSQPSNQLGFFTGLMTEWYHVNPYYGGEQQVTYSLQAPVSSAVLWIDELDTQSGRTVLFLDSKSVEVSQLRFQNFIYQNASITWGMSSFMTGTIALGMLEFDLRIAQESVLPYVFGVPQTSQVDLTVGFQVDLVGGFPPYFYEFYFDGKLVGNGTVTGPPAPPFIVSPNLYVGLGRVNPGNHTYHLIFHDANGLSESSEAGSVEVVSPAGYQKVCQPYTTLFGGIDSIRFINETFPSGYFNASRTIGGYYEGISSTSGDRFVLVGCSLHATIPPNSTESQYVGGGFWFDPSTNTFTFRYESSSASALSSGLFGLYEVLAVAMLGPVLFIGYRLAGRTKRDRV